MAASIPQPMIVRVMLVRGEVASEVAIVTRDCCIYSGTVRFV